MMEDKEEYEKEKNKNSSSSSATETETEKKTGLMNYFKQLGMPFLAWWTGVWESQVLVYIVVWNYLE